MSIEERLAEIAEAAKKGNLLLEALLASAKAGGGGATSAPPTAKKPPKAKAPTEEETRDHVKAVVAKHGKPAAFDILDEVAGVKSVAEVPEDRRADVVKACEAKVAEDVAEQAEEDL